MFSRHPCAALGCALLAAVTLCACASTPAPVLLKIPADDPLPGESAAHVHVSSEPVVLVRQIVIPEYMSSQRVRYRSQPDTLAEWPNTYWAERFETGLVREFSASLQNEMPGRTVCRTVCGGGIAASTVAVELLQLDFVRSEGRLKATARIRTLDGLASSRRWSETDWTFDRPVPHDSASGEAEAIRTMLRELAAATASSLCGPGPETHGC